MIKVMFSWKREITRKNDTASKYAEALGEAVEADEHYRGVSDHCELPLPVSRTVLVCLELQS